MRRKHDFNKHFNGCHAEAVAAVGPRGESRLARYEASPIKDGHSTYAWAFAAAAAMAASSAIVARGLTFDFMSPPNGPDSWRYRDAFIRHADFFRNG